MIDRRILMNNNNNFPVTDGLLFWFDGKNNLQGGGFDQNSSQWYPIMCTPELDGKYLNKNLYASWIQDGGISATNTSSWAYTTTTPFSYLDNVYDVTFIIILNANSNIEKRYIGEYINGNCRGVFTIGDYPEEDRIISGSWQYWKIITANGNIPHNNIVYITDTDSNKTYLKVYRDNEYLGLTTKTRYARPKGGTFVLGGYGGSESEINVTGNLKGTLYSVVCYNRALSENEITKVVDYLNKRYKLSYLEEDSIISLFDFKDVEDTENGGYQITDKISGEIYKASKSYQVLKILNGILYTNGNNGAIEFNNSLTHNNEPLSSIGTGNFSIEFLFIPKGWGYAINHSYDYGGNTNYRYNIGVGETSGKISFAHHNGSTWNSMYSTSTFKLDGTEILHVIITREIGVVKMYINGVLEGQMNDSVQINTNSSATTTLACVKNSTDEDNTKYYFIKFYNKSINASRALTKYLEAIKII